MLTGSGVKDSPGSGACLASASHRALPPVRYTSPRFSLDEEVLSIVYVALLRDVLREAGFPLRGYALPGSGVIDYRRRISPLRYADILEQSLAPCGHLGLGFQYGRYLDIAAAGTVGQLLMSSATIEHAFVAFLRYYPLLSLSMQFDIARDATGCRVRIDRIYRQSQSSAVQWFLTEALLNCWLTQARWLSGKPLQYQEVHLRYPAPPHAALYSSCFGGEIAFGAPYNQVTVGRAFLKSAVLTSNPTVCALKEQNCRDVLRRWESRFSIREQIYTILLRTHPLIPDLDDIAAELHQSRSSLYRKLRCLDTSYQQLVDDFRRQQAMRYLRDSRLTIAEIAEALGFSDASNFRRAFKKWTGLKPSTLRASPATH